MARSWRPVALAVAVAGLGAPSRGAAAPAGGTLLRVFEDGEYNPEYGTLVVRDFAAAGTAWVRRPPAETPRPYPRDSAPSGTFIRAGDGWLNGAARDGYHVVRMEAHLGPPAAEQGRWDDIAETPYRNATGWVGLSMLIGPSGQAQLELGPPGLYMVRVARRRGGREGDAWLLRFWPATAGAPRWIARGEPVVTSERTAWDSLLGVQASHLVSAIRSATAGNGLGITAAALEGRRPRPWLDGPLVEPAPRLPSTGHADLDAQREEQGARRQAREQEEAAERAEAARQLGVPAPQTSRDLLPLLVKAGVLASEGTGPETRYRPGQPRRIDEALRLPPARMAQLLLIEGRWRYGHLASDLLSLVAWAPAAPARVTIDGLARQLVAPPADLRAALHYAAADQLLVVEGNDDRAGLGLTMGSGPPRREAPPRPSRQGIYQGTDKPPRDPVVASAPPPDDVVKRMIEEARRRSPPGAGASRDTVIQYRRSGGGAPAPPVIPLPLGKPPRAGFVTAKGALVVWRDGRPVVLAPGTGNLPRLALETAHGTLLVRTESPPVLVRPDGTQLSLETKGVWFLRLDDGGRHLGMVESHGGRHPWHRIHLVDLADGSRRTWEGPKGDQVPAVYGVRDGAVFLSVGGFGAGLRWVPGSEPTPVDLPRGEVDSLSGAMLVREGMETRVVEAGGTTHRLVVDLAAQLAPGGRLLYTLREEPPAITLYDVASGTAKPRIYWLPPGVRLDRLDPAWEDEHHLLFLMDRPNPQIDAAALRLDVRNGALERVPLTPDAGHRPMFVRPLLRRR